MLHVPVDRPVKLVLDSDDVIHSFYVPQFRIKKDAVPGRYNKTWFVVRSQDNPKIADGAPGEYDLYCAEYCGTNHSTMLSKVYVYTAADWPAKYEEISRPYDDEKTPAENGLKVYQIRGCAQCHSLDGTRGTGPSFENLFGYEQELKSGETPVADEAFIRQAIMYPNSQGIKGYQPQMPNVNLKNEEIDYIIAFLKSKSDRGGSDEAAAPAGETGAETPAQTPAETGEAQP
jgi:cytochrome c oxidase subunit 2